MLAVTRPIVPIVLVSLALCSAGAATPPIQVPAITDDQCMECHGSEDLSKTNAAGDVIKLFVDLNKFQALLEGTGKPISSFRQGNRNLVANINGD